MEKPKVSVVVATYRRDADLVRALSSLREQTYKDFEVVVVDDNNDLEWNACVRNNISKFSDLNIRLFVNTPNMGSAEARNRGINQSLGEFVTFLDDDDLYLPEKISAQVELMAKTNSDLCITDLNLYDDRGVCVDKRVRSYIKSTDKDSLIRYHLMHHMTGTDTLMFKTSFLKRIGGFPPIDMGDEFYLVLEALNNDCRVDYLPRCDVKAFVHRENGGLSTGSKKIDGENKLFRKKEEYFSALSKKDVAFIKMRHFAVLAYASKTMGDYLGMSRYLIKSFIASPKGVVRLLKSHKG